MRIDKYCVACCLFVCFFRSHARGLLFTKAVFWVSKLNIWTSAIAEEPGDVGRTWPTVLWKLSSLRQLQCGMSGPRNQKLFKKTPQNQPHILPPLALLVIYLFLTPGPSSLPSFPEGSCPNLLNQHPSVGNSASSGPGNLCSLSCWGWRAGYLLPCFPGLPAGRWWQEPAHWDWISRKTWGIFSLSLLRPVFTHKVSQSCHSTLLLKHRRVICHHLNTPRLCP